MSASSSVPLELPRHACTCKSDAYATASRASRHDSIYRNLACSYVNVCLEESTERLRDPIDELFGVELGLRSREIS